MDADKDLEDDLSLETEGELRSAVLALAGRVKALTSTTGIFAEIQARQQVIDTRSNEALREAHRALDKIRAVDSKVVPRWEHERRQAAEEEKRQRRTKVLITAMSLALLGFFVLGYLLHTVRTNASDFRARSYANCLTSNQQNSDLSQFFDGLIAANLKDTSASPDVRAGRIDAYRMAKQNLPGPADCEALKQHQ